MITAEQAKHLLKWFEVNRTFIELAAEGNDVVVKSVDSNVSPSCSMGYLIARLNDWKLTGKPTPTYRPYTREQWERLVCTPVRYKEDDYERTVSVESVKLNPGKEVIIKIDGAWTTPHGALDRFEHLDGTPCGVKEGE